METRIAVIPHGRRELWCTLGQFFCDRDVIREMAGPLYSGDGVTWFVARDGRRVVGFCSLRETRNAYWYDYLYTVPDRRGEGIASVLAAARERHVAALEARPIMVACPAKRWHHYETRGWTVRSRRGAWIYGTRGFVHA